MANSEILLFAGDAGANVESQVDYTADPLRLSGNVPGVAKSALVNKVLRQSSLLAAALAQYIASNQSNDVVDTASPASIAAWLKTSILSNIFQQGDRFLDATGINISANTVLNNTNRGGVYYVLNNGVTVTLPSVGAGGSTGTVVNFVAKAKFTLTTGNTIKIWKPSQNESEAGSTIEVSEGECISVMDNGLAWVVVRTGMEYERLLGLRYWFPVNANTILGASAVGAGVSYTSASTYTVTLPSAANLFSGNTITFYNNTSVNQIVAAAAGETIAFGSTSFGGTVANTFTLPAGTTLTLMVIGAAGWHAIDGTATLSGIASLFGTTGANGYQRLPNGNAEVRGTFTASATPGAAVAVTFPQAFTTFRELVITPVNANTTTASAWFDTPTVNGFNGRCNIASAVCHYVAKGIM